MPDFAYVNRRVTPLKEASIPLTDRGFLFGHALFETILVKEGVPVFWYEHLSRLESSCSHVNIPFPGVGALTEAATLLLTVAGQACDHGHSFPMQSLSCALRVIVTAGEGTSISASSQSEPGVFLFSKEIQQRSHPQTGVGLQAILVKDERGIQLSKIKSNNYLQNLLGYQEAQKQKSDDAIFQSTDGILIESTTANLLWITKNDEFFINRDSAPCLPGVTQNALVRSLSTGSNPSKRGELRSEDVTSLKSLFLVSSLRGCMPILKLGAHSFDKDSAYKNWKHLFHALNKEEEKSIHSMRSIFSPAAIMRP